MPPFQDPGQRSIGIARFMGLLRGELVPRPMQPHHADGQLWPAAIVARLITMAYLGRVLHQARLVHVSHVHVQSYSSGPPAESFLSARDVTFCPLVCFGFLISPHFCQRGSARLAARAPQLGARALFLSRVVSYLFGCRVR